MAGKERVGPRLLFRNTLAPHAPSEPWCTLTFTVYEDVGSFAICAQQYGILVYLCLGEARSLVHRFQELALVLAMCLKRALPPPERVLGVHTVFVMPSVNLTNSIESLVSRHSGRSVRMRLRAELCESELS